jgi:FkbM family methyltransferase
MRSTIRFAKDLVSRLVTSGTKIPTVQIGKYIIETTPNHPLPGYLGKFPLYDQFVPSMCAHIEGTVIDIGANIGDSMTAIISENPELIVVCVEPDDEFSNVLERNILRICAERRVRCVQAFVSSQRGNFSIEKNNTGSTGNMVLDGTENFQAKTLTFTQLLSEMSIHSPSLVKIDTDGFDGSILHSIADHITQHGNCSPIIFFEMQTYLQNIGFNDPTRETRLSEYITAIKRLIQLGYNSYVAFDNFGAPIIKHTDFRLLETLEDYIRTCQLCNNNSPIFFMDIAIYQTKHETIIDESLKTLSGKSARKNGR